MGDDFFKENECTEFCDRRKVLVVKDLGNSQEYRVVNASQKELCKIRIDGCLIEEGERCDYLLLNCEDRLAIFVELKGQDLIKAISQIESSINFLIKQLADFKIYARIVLNKTPTPAINSSTEIKLKKRLKKHNGEDSRELIKYQSKIMEEKV